MCVWGAGRGPRYVPSASADQEDDLSTDAIVAKAAPPPSAPLHLLSFPWPHVVSLGRGTGLRQVSSSIEALRQTSWFSQVTGVVLSHLSVLETASDSSVASPHPGVGAAQEMVCYGIGHFSRSRASQLQAALAVLLKESCGVGGCAWLFDPILTPNERAAAQGAPHSLPASPPSIARAPQPHRPRSPTPHAAPLCARWPRKSRSSFRRSRKGVVKGGVVSVQRLDSRCWTRTRSGCGAWRSPPSSTCRTAGGGSTPTCFAPTGRRFSSPRPPYSETGTATLDATRGKILTQSPIDATFGRWNVYGG